jgi:hypothetical protein
MDITVDKNKANHIGKGQPGAGRFSEKLTSASAPGLAERENPYGGILPSEILASASADDIALLNQLNLDVYNKRASSGEIAFGRIFDPLDEWEKKNGTPDCYADWPDDMQDGHHLLMENPEIFRLRDYEYEVELFNGEAVVAVYGDLIDECRCSTGSGSYYEPEDEDCPECRGENIEKLGGGYLGHSEDGPEITKFFYRIADDEKRAVAKRLVTMYSLLQATRQRRELSKGAPLWTLGSDDWKQKVEARNTAVGSE